MFELFRLMSEFFWIQLNCSTFAATEIFYVVSLLSGLGIAMKPLLDHQESDEDCEVI